MTYQKITRWHVVFVEDAQKDFGRLSYPVQNRLSQFLERLADNYDILQSQGKPLQGKYKGLWRHRMGDYRIICSPNKSELTLVILEIGHRREVYR